MHQKNLTVLAAVALAAGLSACSTATPKTAALYAPKVVVTGARPVSTVQPVMANTGVYPTFGRPITAANVQMDDVEATRVQARMAGLTAQHNSGAVSDAEYQKQMTDLRQLAISHSVEMQNRIAN